MSGVTAVRFVRQYRIYNSGEVAGFDEAVATALIAAGVAELADAGGKARSKAKSKPSTAAPAAEGGEPQAEGDGEQAPPGES